MLSSPVSMTTSARSRSTSSIRRSSAIDSSTPRAARGWRRRVPSNRRTSTSSGASRKRTRTRWRARPGSRGPAGRPRSSPPPRPITRATRSVSEPGRPPSSATLVIRAGGRLSMTNQPRSSRVAAAVERPAPDMPVTTRNSLIAPQSRPSGRPPAGNRRRRAVGRGGRRGGPRRRRRPPGRGASRGCAGPRGGRPQRPHPAHLLQQAGPAGRAQAGDPVERAGRHPLAPALAVVGDGEAVGLVAHPLEQVERLGLPRGTRTGSGEPGR